MDKIITHFVPSVLITFIAGAIFGWNAAIVLPLTYAAAAYGFYRSYADMYFVRKFVPLSGIIPTKGELVSQGLGFGFFCILGSYLGGVMVNQVFF